MRNQVIEISGTGQVNFTSCHQKEELRRANSKALSVFSIQLILRDQTSFYGIQIGIQHDKRSLKLVLYRIMCRATTEQQLGLNTFQIHISIVVIHCKIEKLFKLISV